jgi:hypothetical protein
VQRAAHDSLVVREIDGDVEAEIVERFHDWREELRRNVKAARLILKKLLVGPLVLTPGDDGVYRFDGTANLGELVAIGGAFSVASPGGPERSWTIVREGLIAA